MLARLHVAETAAAALEGAIYAQESTPERAEIKREVYAMLDAAADPETILASSTTALLPSSFTEDLKGRARDREVTPRWCAWRSWCRHLKTPAAPPTDFG